MGITDRIYQFVDYKRVSISEFSKTVGVSNGYFAKQRANSANIGSNIIEKIVSVYSDLNLSWLVLGIGDMILSNENVHPIKTANVSTHNIDLSHQIVHPIIEKEVGVDYITKTRREFGQGFNEDYKGIPLLPLKAAAGVLSGYVDQMTKYDCDYYLVPEFKDADFLIKINGDSMQPRYLSGDIVACRTLPMDTFFQWNATYAINSEQGILIKRIKKANEDDSITLVSDNKDYEPFDLRKSQIHGLGKVIGLIRLDD